MTKHELKTWPEYFSATINGQKKFELRKNDRNFAVDDILILKEYNPNTKIYTGRSIVSKVNYILSDTSMGLKEGYVILGIVMVVER